MERSHFRFRFPYEGITETITPYIEIDDKLLDDVIEAQRLFPRRLKLVRRFQELIQTKKVLEDTGVPTYDINETNSSKAYQEKNIGYPSYVGSDFEILPVYSEISTTLTRSVYNATTRQVFGQDLQLGVRVEIPLLATNRGEIQIIAGFLNLPSSQIRKSYFKGDASNIKAMNELRGIVELILRRMHPSMNP